MVIPCGIVTCKFAK
jgi:hypothetical protein